MRRMIFLALLIGGCGDDGNAPLIDGSADHDAVIDTPPIDMAPSDAEGQVFLAKTPLIGIAVAMFDTGPLFPISGTAGPCQGGGNQPATSLDAGTLTITGASTPLTLVQDDPGDVYLTPSGAAPANLFTAGATLTVSSTGGMVPAFTGAVTAPQPLEIIVPTTYSRSAPPTFTWGAVSGTNTIWILLASATNGVPGAVLCRVSDTGSFMLTTQQLALLPVGVTQVTAVTYRVLETTLQAGAWSVALRAADGNSHSSASVTQ